MKHLTFLRARAGTFCVAAYFALNLAIATPALAQAPSIQGGDPIGLRGAAISSNGQSIFWAATARPDGTAENSSNLYRWIQSAANTPPLVTRLTQFPADSAGAGVIHFTYPGTGDKLAYTAVLPSPGGSEEVHVLNLATGTDVSVAKDTLRCPMILCVNCFAACLRTVHMSPDGNTVLYSASRDFPFYTVGADGTGGKRLDVYQGTLAGSTYGVISATGKVVFTSAAPFGPTFAPAANDVYIMNLDGSNVQPLTRFASPATQASQAVISRDGSVVAFVKTQSPSDAGEVWIVRSDGTALSRISVGTAASSPSLSDDGALLTFVQDGNVKRSTTSPTTVIPLPVPITNLALADPKSANLSGDGSYAALLIGPRQGLPAAVYRTSTVGIRTLAQMTPVYTPRTLFVNGVASAAGSGSASPGSLFTVYGANFVQSEGAIAAGAPLPLQLSGLTLLVDGAAVPLQAVTPWQVNAQLPQSTVDGTSSFQIRYSANDVLPAASGQVKAQAPEDFLIPGTGALGAEAVAAAFHAGTRVRADFASPAVAGEILEIYAVGLGITQPIVQPGVASPASPLSWAVSPPRLKIGGQDAQIFFSGLVPGLVGVYQVNAKIPAGLGSGPHALTWIASNGTTLTHSRIYVK